MDGTTSTEPRKPTATPVEKVGIDAFVMAIEALNGAAHSASLAREDFQRDYTAAFLGATGSDEVKKQTARKATYAQAGTLERLDARVTSSRLMVDFLIASAGKVG